MDAGLRFGRRHMSIWPNTFLAILGVGIATFLCTATGDAQEEEVPRISLKSGETIELRNVSFTRNCRSILKETPVIEVLEGPEELTLAIKPAMVVLRSNNCSNQVAGGIVMATAKDVKAPKEARLTYRVKYKTLEGDRQIARVYLVSLFP
jgi:hypothetical protein